MSPVLSHSRYFTHFFSRALPSPLPPKSEALFHKNIFSVLYALLVVFVPVLFHRYHHHHFHLKTQLSEIQIFEMYYLYLQFHLLVFSNDDYITTTFINKIISVGNKTFQHPVPSHIFKVLIIC